MFELGGLDNLLYYPSSENSVEVLSDLIGKLKSNVNTALGEAILLFLNEKEAVDNMNLVCRAKHMGHESITKFIYLGFGELFRQLRYEVDLISQRYLADSSHCCSIQ